MKRFPIAVAAIALALPLSDASGQGGAPVTLPRLEKALAARAPEKDIAAIVLDVGVAFRLTPELEKELRAKGATDLVVLAVRNGYRPLLPDGAPASPAEMASALERGATAAEVVAHAEKHGVVGAFGPDSLDLLRRAKASAIVVRAIARAWLESNPLDGSLEQIEALLEAGVEAQRLAERLDSAPSLVFAANPETFGRLAKAGAGPAVQRAVAEHFIERADRPLTLEELTVAQGAGVPAPEIAAKIAEVGVDFETAEDAPERMAATGVDRAIAAAVLARRVRSGDEPLTLEAMVSALRGGLDEATLVEAIGKSGVAFGLTNDVARALASFPSAVRRAAIVRSLAQQGFEILQPAKAKNYDAKAAQGQFDVRLRIDHIEEVVVFDDLILHKHLRGAIAVDEGSELTQPLPIDLDPNTFGVEAKDGRGQSASYWLPSRENGFIYRARIFDEKGGAGRYHLRLTWRRGGPNAGGERRAAPTLGAP